MPCIGKSGATLGLNSRRSGNMMNPQAKGMSLNRGFRQDVAIGYIQWRIGQNENSVNRWFGEVDIDELTRRQHFWHIRRNKGDRSCLQLRCE